MPESSADNKKWYQRPVTYRISGSVLIVLIITYLLLPKSLFHSFNCDTKTNITRTNYQATNGFFIDNQVIVIGPKEAVNTVIGDPEKSGQAGTAGVILNLVEGCDLSYLKWRNFEQVPSPSPNQTPQVTVPAPTQTLQVSQTAGSPSPSTVQTQGATNSLYTSPKLTADQRESLVMRLYEIPNGGESTELVINKINQAGKTVVLADPNYIVSLLDESGGLCGRPYAGGGSPYAGGGSPYAGGGSTTAGPGISSIDFSDQFMHQWAFKQHGINLQPSSNFTGRGVRVGVFDTSPFRNTYLFRGIQIAQPTPLKLDTRNAMGPDPISNHGLFVSGLIHAIAQNSTIKLIRVLNDNGCGNLWEIDIALQTFTSRESAWTRKLNKVVINLSLGVHIPDADHANETQASFGNQHVDWDQIQGDLDKLHAFTFEETLVNTHKMGAVIVAAAGNDSAPRLDETVSTVQDMQAPANFPEVIGVAATDFNGNITCYSNKGDVAAPGGDGGLVTFQDSDNETHHNYCAPRVITWDLEPGPGSTDTPSTSACRDMGNCDFGVMSLLIVPDKNGRWKYDFGIWSGTSFSTPLVSGLAALSFEKIGSNTHQVECLIRQGAPFEPEPTNDLGAGIINIEESLTSNDLLSTCRNIP